MEDSVREYTRNVGELNQDRQWILSPYDSWERNPHYTGPEQVHPEDDRSEAQRAEDEATSAAWVAANPNGVPLDSDSDEIPL